MRFFLAISYFIGALATIAIPKSEPMKQSTNSDLPTRIQTLKDEIKGLEQSIQQNSYRIDIANSWYRWLGVATLVLGALSWQAQRRASDIELASRPASKSLADKNRSLDDAENQSAQIQIAEEKTATEKERNARLKLEGQIAPRRLTGAQIHRLASSLPPPFPKGIVIVSALNDGESSDFADDLRGLSKLGSGKPLGTGEI